MSTRDQGAAGGREGVRVLAVDDEPDNLQILRTLLRLKGGYEVEEAEDGETALARVAESPPDLILLDVMMPGIDGFEVCRRLKSDEATAHIPIMLLTARGDVPSKVRGLEHGADDYVTKPFHPDEVLARIRSLLTIAGLRRQLVDAERLAAVAQVAVTVKHEINNPLAVILGNAELLLALTAPGDSAAQAKLQGIVEQVERIQAALAKLDGLRKAEVVSYQEGTLMISLGDRGKDE